MTDLELGWLAGLLEGEGSFSCHYGQGHHNHVISLNMTDQDVVGRLLTITGMGTVRPRKVPSDCKPAWIWRVYRADHVEQLLLAVRPHMGQRRGARIDDILGHISAKAA